MLHKDFHTCVLANDFLENTVAQILLFLHRLPGSNFRRDKFERETEICTLGNCHGYFFTVVLVLEEQVASLLSALA